VLQNTRQQVASLESQLKEAQARIAELNGGKPVSGKDATPEPGQTQAEANAAAVQALTDAQLAELKESLPENLATAVEALVLQSRQANAAISELRAKEARIEEERKQEASRSVQEAIDANPTLSLWQSAEDKTMWQEAIREDAHLLANPKWANRPVAERFAEVVRRLDPKAAGAAPAPQPAPSVSKPSLAQQAAAVIASKANGHAAVPVTHSDLPAGTPPAQTELQRVEQSSNADLERMFNGTKSLDEVTALLAKLV
jgi:hypothetical protein